MPAFEQQICTATNIFVSTTMYIPVFFSLMYNNPHSNHLID